MLGQLLQFSKKSLHSTVSVLPRVLFAHFVHRSHQQPTHDHHYYYLDEGLCVLCLIAIGLLLSCFNGAELWCRATCKVPALGRMRACMIC